MGSFKNHKSRYEEFKEDAEKQSLSIPSRVELYFLSIFHLIEACISKFNIHINKHQRVRQFLEGTPQIFGNKTENIWRLFQDVETRLRPKFSYGFSWTKNDFEEIKKNYFELEKICVEVLENEI